MKGENASTESIPGYGVEPSSQAAVSPRWSHSKSFLRLGRRHTASGRCRGQRRWGTFSSFHPREDVRAALIIERDGGLSLSTVDPHQGVAVACLGRGLIDLHSREIHRHSLLEHGFSPLFGFDFGLVFARVRHICERIGMQPFQLKLSLLCSSVEILLLKFLQRYWLKTVKETIEEPFISP